MRAQQSLAVRGFTDSEQSIFLYFSCTPLTLCTRAPKNPATPLTSSQIFKPYHNNFVLLLTFL